MQPAFTRADERHVADQIPIQQAAHKAALQSIRCRRHLVVLDR